MSLYLNNSTVNSINEAKGWINEVNNDPSIWNVFLFGNITTIESAIEKWTVSLNNHSAKVMSSEKNPAHFSTANPNKEIALSGLSSLKNIYKNTQKPNASAIVSLVGVLTLIPMVTTCRMFIGWPEVPNLIFMNFLRRQGTRRKNEKESRCHSVAAFRYPEEPDPACSLQDR